MTDDTRPLSTGGDESAVPDPAIDPAAGPAPDPATDAAAAPAAADDPTAGSSWRQRVLERSYGFRTLLATSLVALALGGAAGAGIHAASDGPGRGERGRHHHSGHHGSPRDDSRGDESGRRGGRYGHGEAERRGPRGGMRGGWGDGFGRGPQGRPGPDGAQSPTPAPTQTPTPSPEGDGQEKDAKPGSA